MLYLNQNGLLKQYYPRGLWDANLRNAIKSEKPKAKIIGRGYKVKRENLNEYIKRL